MNTNETSNSRRIAVEQNPTIEEAFIAGFMRSSEGFNGELARDSDEDWTQELFLAARKWRRNR